MNKQKVFELIESSLLYNDDSGVVHRATDGDMLRFAAAILLEAAKVCACTSCEPIIERAAKELTK